MWALLFSGSVFSQEINSGKTKTRISNQNQLKLQERSSIFAQRKMQMFEFDLLSCCEVGVNSIISHALEFARYFFVLAWPLWLIMRPLFSLRSHRIIISVCCFIDGVIFPFFYFYLHVLHCGSLPLCVIAFHPASGVGREMFTIFMNTGFTVDYRWEAVSRDIERGILLNRWNRFKLATF